MSAVVILGIGAFSIVRFGEVTQWRYSDKAQAWLAPRFKDVPTCPSPLLSMSPVDTRLATDFGYPGEYRGTDFKPHGGLRFDTSKSDDISVRLPLEARLTTISRNLAFGEVQHLLEFRNDCGIVVRFAHLYTLPPEFEAFFKDLPEPTEDSSTTEVKSRLFPAGTVVATAVGVPAENNIGFDFGVFDLRQQNAISQNPVWNSIPIHQQDWEQDAYGICWLDHIPKEDATRLRNLKQSDSVFIDKTRVTISDYCSDADSTTLDYNNGLPVPPTN